MMATVLAERAQVPTQIAEWAAWSLRESAGRREIKARRRSRIRHPRLWHWPRITLAVSPWALLAMLYWATGPTP